MNAIKYPIIRYPIIKYQIITAVIIFSVLLSSCSHILGERINVSKKKSPKHGMYNSHYYIDFLIKNDYIEIVNPMARRSLHRILLPPHAIGVKRTTYDKKYQKVHKGLTSWYGPCCNGKDTATRSVFNGQFITAAHRTLPIPSIAAITNLQNGMRMFILINDRGPYFDKDKRVLDVSKRTAEILDFKHNGLTPVKIELLESHTKNIRGIYKYRDVKKSVIKDSLSKRNIIYKPKIYVRIFKNIKKNTKNLLNQLVRSGTSITVKGNGIFLGPMKNINAYLIFLTLMDMGERVKIIIY